MFYFISVPMKLLAAGKSPLIKRGSILSGKTTWKVQTPWSLYSTPLLGERTGSDTQGE